MKIKRYLLLALWFSLCAVTLPLVRIWASTKRTKDQILCSWSSRAARFHPYGEPKVPDYAGRGKGGEWLVVAIHRDVIHGTDRAYSSM